MRLSIHQLLLSFSILVVCYVVCCLETRNYVHVLVVACFPFTAIFSATIKQYQAIDSHKFIDEI